MKPYVTTDGAPARAVRIPVKRDPLAEPFRVIPVLDVRARARHDELVRRAAQRKASER